MNEIYKITPVSKPRMTQRDKWSERPCVVKYWAYKDKCKSLSVKLSEESIHIHFILPMPRSWSKKKKDLMFGKQHKQRPDKDNLEKGLLDAIYSEDSLVSDSRVTKWWGYEGAIIIKNIEPAIFPLD